MSEPNQGRNGHFGPSVLAVCVVGAELYRLPTRPSGIDKRPVAGRVAVHELGLDGDVQVNRKHHGGEGQAVYAYARVGYHRSLDMLRRNGWKGHGPVPWEHEPNRGFLRSLALLALAARAIGETAEWERCSAFLRDSSPTAHAQLLADPA